MSIVFGLLIFVLTLEISLRILGSLHKRHAARKGKIISYSGSRGGAQKDYYAILCYGDSFTVGIGAPKRMGYPSQLERILNSRVKNKTFTVITRAVAGRNTSQMLNVLQSEIVSLKIKPDLVVLLAGDCNRVNRWEYWTYKNRKTLFSLLYNLLYRIRIYKLIIFLWNDIRDRTKVSEIGRSQVFLEKADAAKKIKQLKEKLNTDSNNSKYYRDIGMCYYEQRDCEKAVNWYTRAIEVNPQDIDNYIGLGLAYLWLGKYSEAIKWLKESIKAQPKDGRSYACISAVYSYSARREEAMNWLEEGVKVDPMGVYNTYIIPLLVTPIALIEEGIAEDEKVLRRRLNEVKKKLKNAEESERKVTHHSNLIDKIKNYLLNFEKTHPTSVSARCIGGIRLIIKKSRFIKEIIIRYEKNSAEQSIEDWVKSDLIKIVKTFQAQGIKVILQNYPNQQLKSMEEAAKECSIPLVDNYRIFKELRQKGERTSDYFQFSDGRGHCNSKGYGVMAENVYNKIIEEKLF